MHLGLVARALVRIGTCRISGILFFPLLSCCFSNHIVLILLAWNFICLVFVTGFRYRRAVFRTRTSMFPLQLCYSCFWLFLFAFYSDPFRSKSEEKGGVKRAAEDNGG